jgi:hypothetical protein
MSATSTRCLPIASVVRRSSSRPTAAMDLLCATDWDDIGKIPQFEELAGMFKLIQLLGGVAVIFHQRKNLLEPSGRIASFE